MSELRLGDIIDDYCSRCRRLTDHSVAALVGDEVRKVRCRSCNFDHDYKHGKEPAKRKGALSPFDQILASMNAPAPSSPSEKPRRKKKSG